MTAFAHSADDSETYVPWDDEDGHIGAANGEGSGSTMKVGRTVGWVAVGVGVVAAALYAGIKLRMHYRRPRSPYESFSHAGDNGAFDLGSEYGVGI